MITTNVARSDVPTARRPGARSHEYEELVDRLIATAPSQSAVRISGITRKQKVLIREGIRKPLRVRGYDLVSVSGHDADGDVLFLYATRKAAPDAELAMVETAPARATDAELARCHYPPADKAEYAAWVQRWESGYYGAPDNGHCQHQSFMPLSESRTVAPH
jgi:hypothetical protein